MTQKLSKRTEGFTIIEVLIVLAIAGLIILIVFLAVPALRRNARNTAYRNEASQTLAAVNEFSNNNNGKIPTASVSSTVGSDAAVIYGLTKNKDITLLTVQAATGTTAPTLNSAVLRTGAKCGTGSVTPAGSSRQYALLYAIEDSAGAVVVQCQEG
jgi:prepilin-type N-terminal cleavage/methylation domain-containing protein